MPELVGDLLNDDCCGVAGGSRRLDVDVGAGVLERDLAFQREFGVRYKTVDVSAQLDVPRGVCRVGDNDREARIAAEVAELLATIHEAEVERTILPEEPLRSGLRSTRGTNRRDEGDRGRLEQGDQRKGDARRHGTRGYPPNPTAARGAPYRADRRCRVRRDPDDMLGREARVRAIRSRASKSLFSTVPHFGWQARRAIGLHGQRSPASAAKGQVPGVNAAREPSVTMWR